MQDTFRGRVCECPIVKGVKFVGDGYTNCEGTLWFSSSITMALNYFYDGIFMIR
jgi:hypothetical protein